MASSKRFVGGSRGPVVEAEFRVLPETSLALPVAPSAPLDVRSRPVAARARTAAPATASARKCLVCGSTEGVRMMRVGALKPHLCAMHATTANVAAMIMRMFL